MGLASHFLLLTRRRSRRQTGGADRGRVSANRDPNRTVDMNRIVAIATVAVGVIAAACSESSAPNGSSLLLSTSSAFTTVPAGFSDLNTSFSASPTDGAFQ